jgi:5-methyltetrahydropteroyltriglutamate--homocysteine methyltransferase
LRPQNLLDARARHKAGAISDAELRQVEDTAIRDAVALQEEVGLQAITDGEFRRTFFHVDFLEKLEGVTVTGGIPVKFRGAAADVDFAPPKLTVTGKLGRPSGIETENFKYLRSLTERTPKLCIPSPTMLHFRGGRQGIDADAYPEIEGFFEDLARVYREEIADLADLGCTYLQLDDTNLAYLCDPALRQGARDIGEDPDALPHTYAGLINACIAERPDDMAVCIHLCRGNFRSAWVAEGGYDPVAEVLLGEIDVDGYFLEYDDARSGGFEPLGCVPKGKTVVLGLVTTKLAALESKDELKRRIDEAARYVDMDDLALSPQCGFSSTVEGNAVSVEEQIAKLRLVLEVAGEVWG